MKNIDKKLYHGSSRKLEGDKLLPKQATDLGENSENIHKAIYASNIKDNAIIMAILSCRDIISSSLSFKKDSKGIIYNGWPKQEFIYLYTLPGETFKQARKMGIQYYSEEPVKPLKIEKLKIKDYLYLVRKATEKEEKEFYQKFGNKIKTLR